MANKLKKIDGKSQVQLLNELLDNLTQASGAAGQLIHSTGNPAGFMEIRSVLEIMKEGVTFLAPRHLKMADKPKILTQDTALVNPNTGAKLIDPNIPTTNPNAKVIL